ncbi:MAG TPA: hypothetical protein VEY71_09055 [Chitinophagales bacterium]|nr:hypothetical protein [Chitinophagales bacterium]
MQDKAITEHESLLLIREMIQATKAKLSEDGFMFLLWGWLVFIASLAEFALMQIEYPHHYITWSVLMPLGAVVSVVYSLRKSKTENVKTYVDEFMAYLWGAFVVALLIVLGFMSKIGPVNAYPVLLVLYGIATFVTGGALRFRPLILGGVCCGVLAIVSMFLSFEYQLLALALAVLLTYIVPGHLLRQQHRDAIQGA